MIQPRARKWGKPRLWWMTDRLRTTLFRALNEKKPPWASRDTLDFLYRGIWDARAQRTSRGLDWM